MLKPESCSPCTLYTIGNSFSRPEGEGRLGVVAIAEALGHEEAIDSLPLRPKAQAGSKWRECIVLAGLQPNDIRVWNIIACQPPGNKLTGQWYEARAIETCKQYLKKVVNSFQPQQGKRKVILALGATAFRVLTGRSESVLDVMGYTFPSKMGLFDERLTVIGTVHPSYIKRGNAHLTPLLTAHLSKAVEIAGQEENMDWENYIEEENRSPNNPIPNVPNDDDDDVPF